MKTQQFSQELFPPSKKRKVIKAKPVKGMLVEQRPVKRKRSTAQLAVELKFLDNSLVSSALVASTDWTGAELDPATTLCLSAPAQGDTASNRDGKQIIGKSIHVKGQVFQISQEDQTAPPVGTKVFLALVLDKQTNNAQLNAEDVYTNIAASATTNSLPMRNLNFAKRFKVLRTEEFDFENGNFGTTATDNFDYAARTKSFEWFVPLKDLRINFNSTTTGVVGNVLDNSLHVIGIANATTSAPTISYVSRFRFVG